MTELRNPTVCGRAVKTDPPTPLSVLSHSSFKTLLAPTNARSAIRASPIRRVTYAPVAQWQSTPHVVRWVAGSTPAWGY